MLKNFKSKIAVVLSVGMLFSSITPVFADDVFRIFLDGKPLNVDISLANFKDDDMTMEEFLSEALGGNVTIVTSTEPTTKSKITLPNRKLTDDELKAWIEDYEEQGGANEFELEVVRLVNIERAKEKLPALEIDEALMKGARFKSQEMRDLDYFSHQSPVYGFGASKIGINLFGYVNPSNVSGLGENIGKGYIDPEQVVNGWMNSPGHRRAIMDESFKAVGVGFVSESTLSGNKFWTINFGC